MRMKSRLLLPAGVAAAALIGTACVPPPTPPGGGGPTTPAPTNPPPVGTTSCAPASSAAAGPDGADPIASWGVDGSAKATVVIVGAKFPSNKGLGPLSHIIGTRLGALGRSQKAKFFVAKINKEDLGFLAELLEAGKVRSVIDRRFALSETADALRYLGEGHARGKVIITM